MHGYNSMDDTILAIDHGTQSVRALVFDLKGNLIAKSQVMLEAYFSTEPGRAEQHADYFWKSLSLACQQLWEAYPDLKKNIRGVSITTQRATVVTLDKQGHPLRPAILWLDQRRATELPPISFIWKALFKLAGVTKTIEYFQQEAEANWINQYEPEIWDQTHKFLLLSGFLTYQLTGEYVDSVANQVGFIPFDFKKQAWAKQWDWKWQALPIQKKQLPKLFKPGEVMGKISERAAHDTGIPCDLPLVASGADKACESLGAGCMIPSIACLSYGTTATVNVTHEKYYEPFPFLPPYPSVVPGRYNLEVQIFRGFWMVNWFKEQFGFRESTEAKAQGISPESLFDVLVNEVPPGSMGLILQPYWSPGVRFPGPEAKGAVIGFGDVHTRAHMYRAILEGLAYALREGKEQIEKRTKIPIHSVRVSGGGSQSEAALQLTADIFNCPVAKPHVYETSGLGAAMIAAVGLKLHPSLAVAISEMTRVQKIYLPNPETQVLYEALYQRVYKKLYQHLKPLYREIRAITHYPG